MKMTRTKFASIAVFSLIILVAVFGVSCAKPAAPPAPPAWEKIVSYVAVDLSGPWAQQNQMIISGLSDGWKYINETGGVKGVKIEYVLKDTAGKVDNALAIYNEVMATKPRPASVAFLDGSVAVAMKPRFDEDKVVNILGTGRGPALYPAGYAFSLATDDRDLFAGFCDWLVEKEAGKKPKLAILTWDNVVGYTILEQVCLDYAKSKGIDIVAKELFNVTDVDIGAQLQRIKGSGAEWIYTNTLLIGPARIANDAKARGMTKDFHFAVSGVSHNYTTMALGGGLEGWVGPNCWLSWDETSVKGVQVIDEQFKKNNRTAAERQNVYIGSFVGALLISQTYADVVDKFGWGGLTGSNYKQVLENTKDFTAMGLTKISFSKTLRAGVYFKMYEMTQGKIIPTTDWREAHHLE
jgi:branched-chain amino acid transport system substrate-binding protein